MMFENLREDLGRYGGTPRARLRAAALTPGVWATAGYRFARWAHTAPLNPAARRLMNFAATLAGVLVDVLTNIEIPPTAEIGAGLYIAHTGYIVVAAGSRLGRNCTLAHGVTIGHAGGGASGGFDCPVVGDRVYVGPGAAIIGGVRVGSDALVGVGAVVTRDVPPRGVAVGNPARVISLKGSFDLVSYGGMERDPDRLRALGEPPARATNEVAQPRAASDGRRLIANDPPRPGDREQVIVND
jgi:serine O-acetyltransferase